MISQSEVGRAAQRADDLLETAIRHPERLLDVSSPATKWKSLDQKMTDLYVEETRQQALMKNLKPTSHLLDKLVERECLNTLVLNLYPGDEGYSLLIKGRNGMDAETVRLPYEEHELLDYIDAEELPPVLADLLDRAQANLFYSGNVIVELRDYRRSVNNSYNARHILLKPTSHTLLCDIAALTNDGNRWTQEDKFALESELLLHTSPPLCLDPTPTVFFLNKLHAQARKLSTHVLQRSVKKFSQAAVNRKRKMSQCPAPKHLRLHDFIAMKREKAAVLKQVDTWRQRDIVLDVPESIEVDQFTKVLEHSKYTYDNTPKEVERYTLETERITGKVYHTGLTISQRMSDEFYFGELYVDRDFFTSGPLRGSTCKFQLGTRGNVEKYIKQFMEIITEEGRRSVKITHHVPGQPAVVSFTQIVPHFTPAQAQPDHTELLTRGVQLAASINPSGDAQNGKRPVQLSIQINAHGGATNSQIVSPQGATQGATATAVSAAVPTANAATSAQSVAANPQLVALQQQQQLVAAARARQLYANRAANAAISSPATTPTGKSQLPTYSQATAMVASQVAPPGGTSSSLSAAKSRRISQTGETIGKPLPHGTTVTITQGQIQSSTPNQQPTTTVHSQPEGAVGSTPTTLTSGLPAGVASLNLTGFGSGISLQSLQNIPGLQVSLANVTMAGGISVPLGLINSTTPTLTSPTGILINSLPRVTTNTTPSPSPIRVIGVNRNTGVTPGLASPPTLVTMVTVTQTTTTSSTSSSGATTATAMPTPSNIFSLPIGSFTQLIKNSSGIRQGAPLSLLQIPGQQPVQLLSTGLAGARTQVSTQPTITQAATQKDGTPVTAGLLSTQLNLQSGLMTSQPQVLQLSSPQLAALRKQQQAQAQLLALQQQQQQQKSSSSSSHKKKKRSKNS